MKKQKHVSLEIIHTYINKCFKQGNNGITLIALVITIIVLLLLAGVTIITLTGNNGIIHKSKQATELNEQAALEEEVKLKITEKKATEYEETNQEYDLGHYLQEIQDANVEKIEDTDAWHVTRRIAELTVYEDGSVIVGKINIWDGETIEAPEIDGFNWKIYNCAQLKFFADFVNNGNILTDEEKTLIAGKGYNEENITITEETQVNLMENLDLGARQKDGNLISGKAWTPIGTTSALKFIGTFEGNNKLIRGIYINQTEKFAGLFGNSNGIKNLTIENSYIKGSNSTGGIVGALRAGTLENCHNVKTEVQNIVGSQSLGGICGQSQGVIKDCTNSGTIIGEGLNTGGIVGLITGNTNGCTNTGKVNSSNNNVAGIVGSANSSASINNCNNKGQIIGEKDNVAGIIGYSVKSNTIDNCTNAGIITGKGKQTGGIVGNLNGNVNDCTNTGEVTGENIYVAGIVGLPGSSNSSIINCTNTGAVNGKADYVGGITIRGTTTNCTNTGLIVGQVDKVAGIIIEGNAVNCTNKGKVQGKNHVGGIAVTAFDINGCKNEGVIEGEGDRVGGIAGVLYTSKTISDCINMGQVKSNGGYIGGVAGSVNTSGNIKNCANTQPITGNNHCTGGIAGYINTSAKLENCYNSGNVKGTSEVGGILGYIWGTEGKTSVTKCYNRGSIEGNENMGAIIGTEGEAIGLNTLNKLYYLNTIGIQAINGKDDEVNEIKSVTDDINSYEEFSTWIVNK